MRSGAYLLVGVAVGIAALALSCDSLECGSGTHEESGTCVANAGECLCGAGTVRIDTDTGCHCEVVSDPCGPLTTWDGDGGMCRLMQPLAGALVCYHMIRPWDSSILDLPAPCTTDTVEVGLVLATATDDTGGRLLAGGQGTITPVAGGTPLVDGLTSPFLLDGQPAHVPLVVETDGTFATDPGARLFEWPLSMGTTEDPQPPLVLRDVSVTGVLDTHGRPDSRNQSGRVLGCFSRANAEAISITLLSQTLAEMIDDVGAVMDCDGTGGGVVDGYTLEWRWSTGGALDVYD
jgi:hypothetical protein